jgi:hypothetical protein
MPTSRISVVYNLTERKTQFERPRRKWEDNSKRMDEHGGVPIGFTSLMNGVFVEYSKHIRL